MLLRRALFRHTCSTQATQARHNANTPGIKNRLHVGYFLSLILVSVFIEICHICLIQYYINIEYEFFRSIKHNRSSCTWLRQQNV